MPYILFGHAAGGQFLSRLSAYSPPADAKQIVIANASVHVLPSLEKSAPCGLGGVFPLEEIEDRLKAYLALPITIFLGDQDKGEKNSSGKRRRGVKAPIVWKGACMSFGWPGISPSRMAGV